MGAVVDRECREEKKKVNSVRRQGRRRREEGGRRGKSENHMNLGYRKLCERKKLDYKKKEEKELEKITSEK